MMYYIYQLSLQAVFQAADHAEIRPPKDWRAGVLVDYCLVAWTQFASRNSHAGQLEESEEGGAELIGSIGDAAELLSLLKKRSISLRLR